MQCSLSAEDSARYSPPRLLECLQIFQQFLFVLIGELGAVYMLLIAIPHFVSRRKKMAAAILYGL
jgi:hypothetical protein